LLGRAGAKVGESDIGVALLGPEAIEPLVLAEGHLGFA